MVTSLQVMNMNDQAHEQEAISALADGQLRGEEFARAVESATADAQARATWHAYHVVGDVLRCGALAACRQDLDFVARLKTRLHYEQLQISTDIDPNFVAEDSYPPRDYRDNNQNRTETPAANEAIFRWKLVAGFASLAAVAAISWSALGGGNFVSSQPQLAQAVVSVPSQAAQSDMAVADSAAPVVIRDPRLDAFLAAHEQFVGTSALQMPSGFFRNATFDGPTR